MCKQELDRSVRVDYKEIDWPKTSKCYSFRADESIESSSSLSLFLDFGIDLEHCDHCSWFVSHGLLLLDFFVLLVESAKNYCFCHLSNLQYWMKNLCWWRFLMPNTFYRLTNLHIIGIQRTNSTGFTANWWSQHFYIIPTVHSDRGYWWYSSNVRHRGCHIKRHRSKNSGRLILKLLI